MFVGNLDFRTTQEELGALFGEAGEVESVVVPADRDSGRPRGFAFVVMTDPSHAAAALERYNGFELRGRALRVSEAADPGDRFASSPGPGSRRPTAFAPRSRPKGSRRNVRARKRGF